MNISSDAQKQQLFFAPCTNSNTQVELSRVLQLTPTDWRQEYREVTRTFETENVEVLPHVFLYSADRFAYYMSVSRSPSRGSCDSGAAEGSVLRELFNMSAVSRLYRAS